MVMAFCSNQAPLKAVLFGLGIRTQEFNSGKASIVSGFKTQYSDPIASGVLYPIELEMVQGNVCGIATIHLSPEDAISLADHIYDSYRVKSINGLI